MDDAFRDARQLEQLRFSQLISDVAIKRETELRASERKLVAKGLGMSGAKFRAEVGIIFRLVDEVVEAMLASRRDLGSKAPALLEPGHLRELQKQLEDFIGQGVNSVRQRATVQMPGAAKTAIIQEAEQRATEGKARLARVITAIPLESRLGMQSVGNQSVNYFHFANSTVASLNLGNVMGDLNASIRQINADGNKELANALTGMTEALTDSKEIQDDARKETLEHIAVVSDESAKPAEKRKMGPLKSSIAAIKTAIGTGTQLAELWQTVEHALKALGINW